jgi:RimJ/RimL family protein N-acetyltransferase
MIESSRPIARPPLRTRRIDMRLAERSDARFVYELMLQQGNLTMRSFEEFEERFNSKALVGFIASTVRSGEPIGYTNVYDADLALGHAYVGAAVLPDRIGSGMGMEALGLTIDYAFSMWRFRKLYAGTTEASIGHFGSSLGDLLHEEGRLRDHLFFGGELWDLIILALYRSEWTAWRTEHQRLFDVVIGDRR